MRFIQAEELSELLPTIELIAALRKAFEADSTVPPRSHYTIEQQQETDATLLLMPAWNTDYTGVKVATIHPSNGARDLPAVHASYLLRDTRTGQDLALMDGAVLTRLRTAAASALASSFLSRRDSHTLLMIGAGSLAAPLIQAHCAVRPIDRVLLWNRSEERIASVKSELRDQIEIEVVSDLHDACSVADVISCATLSTDPLVRASSVSPGTHVDLVGAYTASMRESDTAVINNASVFVDTLEGAHAEAGDLIQAASESDWSLDDIRCDLHGLCRGDHPGRTEETETTVFKSVGASLEDLAAASLAWDNLARG